MKPSKALSLLLFSGTLLFLLAGCTQVSLAGNYTLGGDQRVSGSLISLSSNLTLGSGSEVTGSVLALCCNVIVDGEVGGDVVVLTGNLLLGSGAKVGGEVSVGSGNLTRSPEAQVGGPASSSLSLTALLKYLVLPILACAALPLLMIFWIVFAVVRCRRKALAPPAGAAAS